MTALLRHPAAVVLAACAALAAGCTGQDPPSAAPSPSAAAVSLAPGCAATKIETGRLPDWADAGFSGDAIAMHVIGVRGDIAAVLFGHPLTVDRKDGASNKILWVSREVSEPGTLTIKARRDGTGEPVLREVTPGPGPSIIDLPQAGCWRLELSWPGHTDTMDLVYAG
ncbi:hypothetical protein [Catellatospora sichuanensis]|uniref:hypothetical protein n=1 Tax=Catellatospora sichuanensis TaxID=1969805 RepID=UPI001183B3D4|nr:hypothetical protein [Catellatospora sichuanensis]